MYFITNILFRIIYFQWPEDFSLIFQNYLRIKLFVRTYSKPEAILRGSIQMERIEIKYFYKVEMTKEDRNLVEYCMCFNLKMYA